MKVQRIQIKNFRSLREVSMENVGDMTVIIGENSSGKSNFLEALDLFFNELDPAPKRNIGAVNDYIWFDRNSDNTIEFLVSFALSAEELADILPKEIHVIKEGQSNTLDVARAISGTPTAASWSTTLVAVNGNKLVENGELLYKLEENKTTTEAPQPQQPTVSPTQLLGGLLQSLSKKLMGKYNEVPASRDTTGAPARFGDRFSFVNQTVISEITTYGDSGERDHQKKWREVEEHVTRTARGIRDLRVIAAQITAGEPQSAIRYPISLVGGGHQEVLALIHELTKNQETIYGLEEPEEHLHPELARHFFDELKEISKNHQIFFTTHSTIFVDRAELKNTWIVRKDENESKLVRIHETSDLQNILYELGARPSDIFFANAVLFVEGPTERVVFPTLARKLGIDFREIGLSVIPTRGKGSSKYHLHVWIEASKAAQVPYFLILDKDAENEAKKLAQETSLNRDRNLFILNRGSIEEYYPEERIIEAIKSEYVVEIGAEERKEILESPRTKAIEKFLGSKRKDTSGWKVVLGAAIATAMSRDEIDGEIRTILERLQSELSREE